MEHPRKAGSPPAATRKLGRLAVAGVIALVAASCGDDEPSQVLGTRLERTTSTSAPAITDTTVAGGVSGPITTAASPPGGGDGAGAASPTTVATTGRVTGELHDRDGWTVTVELSGPDGAAATEVVEPDEAPTFTFADVEPGTYRLVTTWESEPGPPPSGDDDSDVHTAMVTHRSEPFAVEAGSTAQFACDRQACRQTS